MQEQEPLAGLVMSARHKDLVDAAVEIEQEDARAAGSMRFLAKVFCQSALPYRNPGPDTPVWLRQNGDLSLMVRPRVVPGAPGEPFQFGWPYGVIPRLLMVWMTTEVVRGSDALDGRTLHLGDSLSDFMSNLGMPSSGGQRGSLNRVREQVLALAGSTITVEHQERGADGYSSTTLVNSQVADRAFVAWSMSDPMGTASLLSPSITLSEPMLEMMKTTGVPLDERALKALRTRGGGGLSLDIYAWLAHRLPYMRQPTLVPWGLLALQFGSQYDRLRDFRSRFLAQLPNVLAVYREARVEERPEGLYLKPSRPAVARKTEARRIGSPAA